jgi:hypothetical protein
VELDAANGHEFLALGDRRLKIVMLTLLSKYTVASLWTALFSYAGFPLRWLLDGVSVTNVSLGRIMTRNELLQLLIGQARANGFEFRKWYVGRLRLSWTTAKDAVEILGKERRYYALLFSHEFAESFWKAGQKMTFQVPEQTFQRTRPDGSIGTVKRKGFIRRSSREDTWKYHLRELAVAEEPLLYMKKFLRVEETMDPESF